jgi:hypothetical protein
MRASRSAIVAFCLLTVCPGAAWGQVSVAPSSSGPTLAASADAANVAVSLEASIDPSGGGSGSAPIGGTATTPTTHVDVAAGTGADSGGARVAVDLTASPQTPSDPPPTTPAGARTPKASHPESSGANARQAASPDRVRATRAPRHDGFAGLAGRPEPRTAPLAAAPRTDTASERQTGELGGDGRGTPAGSTPDAAAPSGGGTGTAVALLSLLVVLIPLASWVLEHAAAGSPRQFFASLLERPG